MKDFVYNKGGTAIIRPLHFHDVKGFFITNNTNHERDLQGGSNE